MKRCIILIKYCLALLSIAACQSSSVLNTKEADQTASILVSEYITNFASKDIQSMVAKVAQDIKWTYVVHEGKDVTNSGINHLKQELVSYFSSIDLVNVEIVSIQQNHSWVTVIEKPTWLQGGIKYSQQGLAVYYVEKGKIKKVWYYPAFYKQNKTQ